MAIVRWDPAREIDSLQGEMNRLFSSFFDTPGSPSGGGARWLPAMDLIEGDEHYLLRVDLPGLREEDVNVQLEHDVLTISGERRTETDSAGNATTLRIERAVGAFSRQVTLPDGVDADGVAASFDRGVLEVRVPKPVQVQPRRVEITVGHRESEAVAA